MSSRICAYCTTSICEAERTQGMHHEDHQGFEISASEQCVFCSSLQHDVEQYIPDPKEQKWPLYRWSLRRAASIRESSSMIAIVFRSLAPYEPADHENASQVKRRSIDVSRLPERTFHFYREKDLGHVPGPVDLGMRTDSEESWSRIAAWMANCTGAGHPRCRRRRVHRFVPTRLLDISAVKPQQKTYGNIIVTETRPSDVNKRYATLSHTWGPDPKFVTLTVDNRKEFMSVGIPWDDLTNNFREAIIVARRLRIRHIWIDSLCIVQGEGGDFLSEKDKMHQVYRQSFCNIAAADACDDASGLFRSRQPKLGNGSLSIVPASFRSTAHNRMFGDDVWRVIPNDLWDSKLLKGSLYKRAWVFQERILAPRIIHFGTNQIFWDCSTISACEVLPSGLPRPIDTLAASDRHWRERLQDGLALKHRPLGGTADLSVEEFWRSAVRNYTSCALKEARDKLSAIWGVAKLLRDALEEEYGAGLWSEKLEEQLAWRVVGCRQGDGSPSVRPEPSWVPSWSWASVNGVIDLQDRLMDREFTVSNHAGGDIEFHVQQVTGSRKSPRFHSPEQEITLEEGLRMWTGRSPQPTPHLSRVNSGLSQDNESENLQPQHDVFESPKIQQDNDEHPELQTPGIEIRGCVRSGQLQPSDQVRKWTLSVEYDEEKSPPNVFETGTLEAFPDEEPKKAGLNCFFMVLAFSEHMKLVMSSGPDLQVNEQQLETSRIIRYTHKVPVTTYSGIGLLLKDQNTQCFSRIGSFRFHDFTEARMNTLTLVDNIDDISHDPEDKDGPQMITLI